MTTSAPIRTRFAPSPTGMLHIGGARTALFNYLFARHHGGAFLLRIEDTDRQRSTQEAIGVILEGLAWLGITPDEEPVYQSTRAARHAEVAHAMLEAGTAYRCWCTPEELAAMRAQAAAAGKPPRYNGYWRDRDPATAPEGIAPVIRLKAPREGTTTVNDLVQGTVSVANAEMDDLIILRSDGTPTYLHAVVVDDHDMAITHVIRGDDHLTNTFRQMQIYNAMGWGTPEFGHIPLIHGADGAKLSKRHGAVSVLQFREEGYLPEALCNYLLRLGWGHGDAEILSRDEQIALFDLGGVGRSASRMDYAKLGATNGVWLRRADDARIAAEIRHRLPTQCGITPDETAAGRIETLAPHLKERARTLVELTNAAAFLARRRPIMADAKAAALLTDTARARLARLHTILAGIAFEPEILNQALRDFAAAEEIKLGDVAQALRAALTGATTSPGIDVTLAALGREEALARIEDAAKG